MPSIKSAFNCLLKRKVTSLLFIAQFTITIFVLMEVITQVQLISYQEAQIKKYLNLDMNKTIRLEILNINLTEDSKLKIIKFENYIKNLKGIEDIGGYDLTRTSFIELSNNREFLNLRKTLTTGSFKANYPNVIEIFKMEKGISELIKINIVEGGNFIDTDFETHQKIMPILIGNKYAGILRLNDVITDEFSGAKYQVIGFIGDNNFWFNDQDYISNSMISLDDKFVAPYTAEEEQTLEPVVCKCGSLFYTVNNLNELINIKEQIEQKANELHFSIKMQSVKEDLAAYKTENMELIYYNLFFCLFVGIMSLLGLIVTTTSLIVSRKKEFGIRMTAGASKRYIKALLFEENLIVIGVSSVIANLIIIYLNYQLKLEAIEDGQLINPLYNINGETILISIIIVILISFISIIIPFKKVNQLNPAELIGGTQ